MACLRLYMVGNNGLKSLQYFARKSDESVNIRKNWLVQIICIVYAEINWRSKQQLHQHRLDFKFYDNRTLKIFCHKLFIVIEWAIPGLFVYILSFLQLKIVNQCWIKWPMTGFEPWSYEATTLSPVSLLPPNLFITLLYLDDYFHV